MKINPIVIAAIGGAVIFYFWKRRMTPVNATPQALSPSSVPQEWIESTPQGVPVIGTSNQLYDILT